MAGDLEAAFGAAHALEREENLAAARAAYRNLLARWPDCALAWYNLGNLEARLDQQAAAIAAWREAIARAPHFPEALVNLAAMQLRHGEAAAARAAAAAALRQRPDWPLAWCTLGNAFQALGQWAAAVGAFRTALRHQPDYAEAAFNLGNALSLSGDVAGAAAAHERAAQLKPGFALAHLHHGNALHALGDLPGAVRAYHAALAFAPDQPEALTNLCVLMQESGDLAQAIAHGRAALARAPDFAEAAANLGNALLTVGDFAGAEDAYCTALARRGDFAAAWSNLGAALRDQGRLGEAESACRAAIALQPEMAGAHYNLALTLLTAGRFAEGWAEHEWRWRIGTMRPRDLACPPWRGEAVAGRRILLHAEQGLGDTLQFARYAPLLAARGAHVILEVQAPLKRLCATLAGVAEVYAAGEALPAADLHAPLMSLPYLFRTELTSVPAATPYFATAPAAEPVASAGHLRVGLVWAGDPRPHEPRAHFADRRRSLPLEAFAPLAAIAGVRFVSLQLGTAACEPPPPGLRLDTALTAGGDFADTASVIAGLDLVISVDTAVAHLAGALGKPVWLLSRFDGCWRWLRDRDDSPWYPTLKLYRQSRPGDWARVVSRIAADLTAEAARTAKRQAA